MASFMPVRRSQRIAGRLSPEPPGRPSEICRREEPASAETPGPDMASPVETAAPAGRPAVHGVTLASKWSLRPRQLTSGRLLGASKRKRSKDDDAASHTSGEIQSRSAATFALQQAHSQVTDVEARSVSWHAAQRERCMRLRGAAPWRRYWKKMSLQQAFLSREARVKKALKEREELLRQQWQQEVGKMREELAGLQKQQSEEILAKDTAVDACEAEAKIRKKELRSHEAAVAELRSSIKEAKGGEEPEVEEQEMEEALPAAAPKGRAAPKVKSRNMGWSRKPKRGAAVGRSTEVKAARSRVVAEASPEPTRVTSVDVSEGAAAGSSGRDLAASPRGTTSPRASSPLPAASTPTPPIQPGSPLARSPPPSPSVPKASAPFVEFVGAPVGKGSKVPSGMWPWPTEMMTRSRAKAL
eukprot:TRINITY_DN49538_c0_g1_i1.p2 TRINITY_DN49538_c0_g1~~TRINITY_DN49538_c0_g1_i1.p2  ORF type:complete len:414 (+),score=95.03 TRINITY_DN49538_c0_g1_i1:59-1300(+)